MSKQIEVAPYDPQWPVMFECESKPIWEALGKNCVAVHHVGSTSVPGLPAKPKIDIIAEVKDTANINTALEKAGYAAKGEFNIPFHCGFAKRESQANINLHVYEEGNPEVNLNLLFRDYLRNHRDALEEYARLKLALVSQPSSHEKDGLLFRGYNLGKDEFIKKILQKTGFDGLCIRFCTHYHELEAAKKFRQRFFRDHAGADPYAATFDDKDHLHFIFYQGIDIIGYAHFQLRKNQSAALRIFIIDGPEALRSHFLVLCERWLKRNEYHELEML